MGLVLACDELGRASRYLEDLVHVEDPWDPLEMRLRLARNAIHSATKEIETGERTSSDFVNRLNDTRASSWVRRVIENIDQVGIRNLKSANAGKVDPEVAHNFRGELVSLRSMLAGTLLIIEARTPAEPATV